MANKVTVTLTEAQLNDVCELFGMTRAELKARKVATPKGKAAPVAVMPPADSRAEAYGTVSDELNAWMAQRHDPAFTTHYKPVPAWKPKYTTTPLPKSFFAAEKDWNAQAAAMHKAVAEGHVTRRPVYANIRTYPTY